MYGLELLHQCGKSVKTKGQKTPFSEDFIEFCNVSNYFKEVAIQ